MFDARGWMVWLLAAAVLVMMTRNPLYTLILLLAVKLVDMVCARPDAAFKLPLLRIGAVLLLLATLFNALFVHVGSTVLFRIPSGWPWVGGPVTVEAAVYGAVNGLMLLTLLALFTTFNNIVTTGELVRFAPRALRDLAVVVLIAITYMPETMNQLKRIREAQAIRGHRVQGIGDWRPVLIPLLIGGLERAMSVAEAMVARGYGSTTDADQPFGVQLALLAGLLAAFAGWVLSFWIGWPGWLLMGVGIAIIGVLMWRLGRQTPFTRYREMPLTVWNVGLMGTAVLAVLLLIIPLPLFDRTTLAYTLYPALSLPRFDVWIGLTLLLLIYPAVVVLLNVGGAVVTPATAVEEGEIG